jgi:hypothetical protein
MKIIILCWNVYKNRGRGFRRCIMYDIFKQASTHYAHIHSIVYTRVMWVSGTRFLARTPTALKYYYYYYYVATTRFFEQSASSVALLIFALTPPYATR